MPQALRFNPHPPVYSLSQTAIRLSTFLFIGPILFFLFVFRIFTDCFIFLIMDYIFPELPSEQHSILDVSLSPLPESETFFLFMKYCSMTNEILRFCDIIDSSYSVCNPDAHVQSLRDTLHLCLQRLSSKLYGTISYNDIFIDPDILSSTITTEFNYSSLQDFVYHSRYVSIFTKSEVIIRVSFNLYYDNLARIKLSPSEFNAFMYIIPAIGLDISPFTLVSNQRRSLRPFDLARSLQMIDRLITGSVDTFPVPTISIATWSPLILEPCQHLSITRKSLVTHISHFLSNSLYLLLTDYGPLRTPSGSLIHPPLLHIHHAFNSPKFFPNSDERIQLYCSLLFPTDAMKTLLLMTHDCSSLNEESDPSRISQWRQGLNILNRLPPELQSHVIELDVLSLFNRCECDLFECFRPTHTSRCKRGASSIYFRLPRIFPIRTTRYSLSTLTNNTMFGMEFIFTIEDSISSGIPSSRIWCPNDSLRRRFIIMNPRHGQFAFPPDPSMFDATGPAYPSENISLEKQSRSQVPFSSEPCSSPTGNLFPRSRYHHDHFLVYD